MPGADPSPLRYRAGPAALRTLRSDGLTAETLSALVGPASGPKWIVLAGLDRALLRSGLIPARSQPASRQTSFCWEPRPLLVGASAGAWRMLALAAREPARAHRLLLDGYVGMRLDDGEVTPERVSEAYRAMLASIFPPDEIAHLVSHPQLNIALHVVRSRIPIGGSGSTFSKATQIASLGTAAALHALSPSGVDLVFERVLFHTRPCEFDNDFGGRLAQMDHGNLLAAAVATGSVPVYMQPQRDLPGAPRGHYLDGGLSDYHLRQRYGGRGITLFPHFRRRIVPVWFDRSRARRAPRAEALEHVLQLYPSEEFVAALPDGRLPDRDDFFRFASDPAERIRRWTAAAELGERLGAAFIEDLRRGRIAELAEPLTA